MADRPFLPLFAGLDAGAKVPAWQYLGTVPEAPFWITSKQYPVYVGDGLSPSISIAAAELRPLPTATLLDSIGVSLSPVAGALRGLVLSHVQPVGDYLMASTSVVSGELRSLVLSHVQPVGDTFTPTVSPLTGALAVALISHITATDSLTVTTAPQAGALE